MFDKATFDQIVFDGSVEVIYKQTLSVTEVSVVVLTTVSTLLKTLSVIESSIVTLAKGLFQTLSVTESSITALIKSFFRTLAVTEVSIPVLEKLKTLSKTLVVTEISVVALTKNIFKKLSVVVVGVISLITQKVITAFLNPKAYDGYRCLIEQYVKRKLRGLKPYKLPDGTTWD